MASWIQTVAVVVALFFSGIATRQATRATRVSNYLGTTQHHRDLWMETLRTPHLQRIFEPEPTPAEPTTEEYWYIIFVIRHFATAYDCVKLGQVPARNFAEDMARTLSTPLCMKVWLMVKKYQPPDFEKFVDDGIASLGR